MHGFSDLEGAEEIAPGTRIFQGGAEGGCQGVISFAKEGRIIEA